MKKLTSLLAFAILFSFAGCGKDEGPKPPPIPSQPFPFLKIGNEWTYEETEYDANNNVTNTKTNTYHIVEIRSEVAN